MKGAPDYTRVTEIRGQDPTGELVTLAVDANGQLYAVVKGIDGTTLRTIAVDASGRIIMVPYGVTSISGTATVTQAEKDREVQGKDGVTLRTLAVDANGQLIMVPRGQSGNYMAVDASGYMTSVMKGVDGVTLRTVAVDASGNIIGVLQGDYAGSLKTLAVDSQGRMLAVLTDPEDVFGNPHYMGAAELAARLGSIVSFDRRGQVVFMDDFESGLQRWDTFALGALASVGLSITHARSGRCSARLKGGSDAEQEAYIYHAIPYLGVSKNGFEVSFTVDLNAEWLLFYFIVRDTVASYWYYLYYYPDLHSLRYIDAAGNEQVISNDVHLSEDEHLFHALKMVVDGETDKWVRVIVDSHVFSMAGIGGYSYTHYPEPALCCRILVHSEAGKNALMYVDDPIITQNEPA